MVAQTQQFGDFSGYNGNGSNGNPPNGDSDSGSGSSSGFDIAPGPISGGNPGSRPGHLGSGFDFAEATRLRAMHGIMAAIAMVALFPSGAILVRLVPGRAGLWLHSLLQMLSLGMLVSAVAVGIHLVQMMRGETGIDLVRACPLILPSSPRFGRGCVC